MFKKFFKDDRIILTDLMGAIWAVAFGPVIMALMHPDQLLPTCGLAIAFWILPAASFFYWSYRIGFPKR